MLEKILSIIKNLPIQEIRLRVGEPIRVYDGKWKFLGNEGIVYTDYSAIIPTYTNIEQLVFLACEKSVYAYSRQIVDGYLTIQGGIRLGICGKVVQSGEKVSAIRDFSSIIMRIPRQIIGCANTVLSHITSPLRSCLVISPPSAGKTTLIRDISRQLGKAGYNCLICDEREEIASTKNGKSSYDLTNCDVLSGCSKEYCFSVGLRSCSPQVIICDEIQHDEHRCIARAIYGGVKVIGTIHGASLSDATKSGVADCFDQFVLLSANKRVGEIVGIYGREDLPMK